jgi:hypothetical protein
MEAVVGLSVNPEEIELVPRLQAVRDTAKTAAAATRYIIFTPAGIRAVWCVSIAKTR